MPREIVLNVNGQQHHVRVEPETPLLFVLRNDLGLRGAKIACGLEQCGACQVLVAGQAVPSCRVPVRNVQGLPITTVEGLGSADNLHKLQKAFVEEQAAQCGYCTPGMIVAAKALLDRNPDPTDSEIRAAMARNLCRCGVYDRVLRAIKRAAGRPEPSRTFETVALGSDYTKADSNTTDTAAALPRTLLQTPDLDSWVRVNADGTITLFTGKVELGQDIRTSIAMIGADELDVSLGRIQIVMADTGQSPDEGYTVSSMSLETSGNAIRYATAQVRHMALEVAHEELEVPIDRLTVTDGTISDPETGRSVTYWDLFAGKRFGVQVRGFARPKDAAEYTVVGQPAQRLDLVAKVTGAATFVQDLHLPGMVHGRVARPPSYGAQLVDLDEGAAYRIPGVIKVVRDGNFVGVVTEREEQALNAIDALKDASTWRDGARLPPHKELVQHVLSQPDQPFLILDGTPIDGPIPDVETPAEAVKTLAATYSRPYQMHASLGPSAAVAQMDDGKLTVWTHSQGVYPLRSGLAQVLGMRDEDIRAIHVDGPGCYGHNGADDAALDASLLARAVPGRPVSLKWTKTDEGMWEPYGAATVIEVQGSLDADGGVVDWNYDVWGYTHVARPRPLGRTSGLLAAWHLAEPFSEPRARPILAPEVGIHRNASPLYTFPRRRIVKHFLPNSPLRVSALRGLGSYANVFAIESFMDELAAAAGADPVEFRLRHLKDARARDVITAAASKANWQPRACPRGDGEGHGIAFAQYKNRQCYIAVVVDLSVDTSNGFVRLIRAAIAADAGQIVNPDGLSNQLEGAFLQSASWTLREQVVFDQQRVTSVDWYSYPILRFHDAPSVETVLLNRPGQPFLGVGEGAQGPVPAAIANAIFDATGARLRDIPFRPDLIKQVIG